MSIANPADGGIKYTSDDGVHHTCQQSLWTAILVWNMRGYFRGRPDMFIAGNHSVYPVRGADTIHTAPDVFIVFGRPPVNRECYRVWEEDDIFPQVVFEVSSPDSVPAELEKKRLFYERYGVLEYYLLHPYQPAGIDVWRREGERLIPLATTGNVTSPLLNFTLCVRGGALVGNDPDGRRLLRPDEMIAAANLARLRRKTAESNRQADGYRAQTARMAAKLRELGVDPDAV